MMKYFSSRYQRHKRIKRILSLQSGHSPYRPKHRVDEGFLFPKYTWIRFLLCLGGMIILAVPLSAIFDALFSILGLKAKAIVLTPIMMAVGFLFVEVIDEFFLEWESTLERIKRVVLPFMAVAFLVFVYVAVKNPDSFSKPILDWRNSVNENRQSRPIQVVITPAQGKNWRFLYENPQSVKRLNYLEAITHCRSLGLDWQVYDGDSRFVPNPNPTLSRSFTVWMNSKGGQLEILGIQPPKVFSVPDANTKWPVLCINKKVQI